MLVIKYNGSKEKFDINKIIKAVRNAFLSCNKQMPQYLEEMLKALFSTLDGDVISINEIQDKIENILMNDKFFDVENNIDKQDLLEKELII